MIIICPACNTKFMLSASAIGAEGRDVRCAKCGHEWHAMLESKEASGTQSAEVESNNVDGAIDSEASKDQDIDEALLAALTAAERPAQKAAIGSALPQNTMWKVSSACAALIVLFLILLLMRESLQPAFSPVYSAFGYYSTEGVVLADVRLRELPSRRKQRYEIECNILNQADEARKVPQLSMQILNESGEVLAEEEDFLENTGQVIAKGKSVPCKGLRFENPFTTAHLIVMDMGSPLELSLQSEWDYPEEQDEEENDNDETSAEELEHE